MSDYADLIERLSNLSGPDRDVDADIAIAIGIYAKKYGLPGGGWVSAGPHHAVVPSPFYTESIDSALTLLPEGWRWKLGYSKHVQCVAELKDYGDNPHCGVFYAEVDSNHAIALCIAISHARAAMAAK